MEEPSNLGGGGGDGAGGDGAGGGRSAREVSSQGGESGLDDLDELWPPRPSSAAAMLAAIWVDNPATSERYTHFLDCLEIIVQCIKEKCPFHVTASEIKGDKTFVIRKMKLKHTCETTTDSTRVSARWLAAKYESLFRSDPNTTIQAVIDSARQHFGVQVPKMMAYRAKWLAIDVVLGDHKEQYVRLRDFAQTVVDTNPGSRVIVTTFTPAPSLDNPHPGPTFHGLFFCINGAREGFLEGCRPFIGSSPVVATTTSNEQPPSRLSAPPVETGSLDLAVVTDAIKHPLGPELVVDPGPGGLEPGPADADATQIPATPGVVRTASSIINRLRHPDGVSAPGRRSGADKRPPHRAVASPTASSTLNLKARLASPSPNREMTSSPRAGSSSPVGSPIILNIEKEEIEISDDEEELNEDGSVRSKRKLTSKAWHSYKRLDKYLEDDYVPLDTKNFNVLDWWKVDGTRYPTLRLIARDIYAIPISTVASESAFSTSGRVLSEHRSRLTPDLLEALMCSQDWIRNRYKDDDNGQEASFWSVLEDIEEGLEGLKL
ncbi:hypothetical protein ACQ4PT_017230 [Festuca glaucescens]